MPSASRQHRDLDRNQLLVAAPIPCDVNTGKAGVDWNAIAIDGDNAALGTSDAPVTYCLDFSALSGDPDGGDPFWQSAHVRPIVLTNVACYDMRATSPISRASSTWISSHPNWRRPARS
jgi:hypothetical protein